MPSAGQLEAFWLKAGIAKLRCTDYFAADSSRLLLLLINTGQKYVTTPRHWLPHINIPLSQLIFFEIKAVYRFRENFQTDE
jgi:hypothetical protein